VGDQESVARAALAEITPADTVGALLERTAEEEGVATLSFAATLSGYPGWHWSVSVAELPGEEPTVLEAELLPGDGALLAPDWVPWAERLEDYRAAQAALAAQAAEADEADDDEPDDDADDDFEDVDVDDDGRGVPAGGEDEEDESEDESADDGPEQPDEA
jgi:hypothetical protein